MAFNRIVGSQMTYTQRRAHSALALLLSEEGTENASDVYADVLTQVREDAFAQKHGLTIRSGTVCLARLFGKRCFHVGDENCSTPHIPPGNSHATLWARAGEVMVYVFQPYKDQLTMDVRERLSDYCYEYGLTFTVLEDESFYYPGKTTLVMIERKYPHDEAAS